MNFFNIFNLFCKNVETKRGGTVVYIYFEDLPVNEEVCVIAFAKRGHVVKNLKKASVKVYVYDNKGELKMLKNVIKFNFLFLNYEFIFHIFR